jgi:hypothetical protein
VDSLFKLCRATVEAQVITDAQVLTVREFCLLLAENLSGRHMNFYEHPDLLHDIQRLHIYFHELIVLSRLSHSNIQHIRLFYLRWIIPLPAHVKMGVAKKSTRKFAQAS